MSARDLVSLDVGSDGPALRLSNFIAADGFSVADIPLSHVVSHWHRPLPLQARSALPLARPLLPPLQDLQCSAHQLYPTLLLLTDVRVVQDYSAWCSAVSRGSPPTETRRRFVLKFPRSQDEDSIFRMQRDAPLNPCDRLSHRSHTSTLAWQSKGSAPSKTTMLPLSITPDTASRSLQTLAP